MCVGLGHKRRMEILSISSVDGARREDVDHARTSLLDALATLDRSIAPQATKAAAYVSHALELLSPGADPFALGGDNEAGH